MMPGIDVTYNTVSIQTANIIVGDIQHDSIATQVTAVHRLAKTNRSKVVNKKWSDKLITVSGKIIGASIVDLEGRIDDFKRDITPLTNLYANLDIGYEGGTRRYVATIENAPQIFRLPNTVLAVGFSVEFLCIEPFGKATTTDTLLNASSVSASPSNKAITVVGNAPEQYLVLTYELTSSTGASLNTVFLKNNATGQEISISRAWAASDELIVDVENKSVTVNGTEVDYDGAFPLFETGSQTLVVSDDFTARSATITATQIARYL